VVESLQVTNQHHDTVLVCEHLYLVNRQPSAE